MTFVSITTKFITLSLFSASSSNFLFYFLFRHPSYAIIDCLIVDCSQ